MMKKIELKQQTLIDKIELRNGQIISIRDVADLIHRDIAYRSNDRMMYETDYGDEFSYLRVVNDKWIHQLKAGITGFGNPYTNLQMGIYDEDTGNLRCNTVSEYHHQLDRVQDYLVDKYGILTDFKESKINMIELNRTFQIDYPFDDYDRVLQLLIAIMPKMRNLSFFGQSKNDKTTMETYTAWSRGRNKKITFYDKGNQLAIDIQENIMRVELMIKTSKNIRNAFGTDEFCKITQEKIEEYFQEQIQRLIVAPVDRWKATRNKFVLQLIKEEYEKEVNNTWQVNVLRKLMNKEIEEKKPCILGIEELCAVIDRYKGLNRKSRIKANLRKQASKYEKVYCAGDDLKLQEIIDKLLATDSATVDLYVEDSVA